MTRVERARCLAPAILRILSLVGIAVDLWGNHRLLQRRVARSDCARASLIYVWSGARKALAVCESMAYVLTYIGVVGKEDI